jgi:hypothetical protein
MSPSDSPQSLAMLLERDPMFANDDDGNPIHRERMCECGRRFMQRLLSERFLSIAEKARAIDLVTKQIPGFFIPVHCPACERRDLGMQGKKDEYKHQPPQPFGEAAD